MERHWYDERTWEDAPVYLSMEEAQAWASGYNAAVSACSAEIDSVLEQAKNIVILGPNS